MLHIFFACGALSIYVVLITQLPTFLKIPGNYKNTVIFEIPGNYKNTVTFEIHGNYENVKIENSR